MDGISNSSHTQNALDGREYIGSMLMDVLTSVDPGSIPSLALSRAPLASWISFILDPPLPMTDPMRELGIMNLMVTARLPGTEGESNGSSLIRLTINPKAYATLYQTS